MSVPSAADAMLYKDWINLGAIFFGPIIALLITRLWDNKRDNKNRKLAIFKTLMMTRANRLHAEHIGALNAIEIEFHDNPAVISAWTAYLENLSFDTAAFSDAGKQAHWVKRDRLFTRLVSTIGTTLKLKVQQLEILDGNYIPQGWHDVEAEQREVRQSLLMLFRGHGALPVHVDESPILKEIFEQMRAKHKSRKEEPQE